MKRIKGVIACLVAMMLLSTTSIYASEGDTTSPDIATVNVVTSTELEITLNEPVTEISAENIANYRLQELYGLKEEVAVIAADLNEDRTKVVLTTMPHKVALYKVYINDVVDDAGNVMDTSRIYVGRKQVNTEIMNRELVASVRGGIDTVTVTFNVVMDMGSVMNTSNYEIEEAYGDKLKLQIHGAVVDESGMKVTLQTNQQLPDTLYKLYVKNVKESNGANIYYYYDFIGVPDDSLDTTPPVIKSAIAISPSQIELTFNEDVNVDTAVDVANYTIQMKYGAKTEVAVVAAELAVRKVTLTVDEMVGNALYSITAQGVTDMAGNASCSSLTFIGIAPIVEHTNLVSNVEGRLDKVIITYQEPMNPETALDVATYIIKRKYGNSDDRLSIMYATMDDTGKVVTLHIDAHTNNNPHVLIIENVETASGTIISDEITYFWTAE